METALSTLPFIMDKFAMYYRSNMVNDFMPPQVKQREFAFLLFQERMMIRHKSFNNEKSFKNFLGSITPSDIYYSSAYYGKPDADEMKDKGWMGADLVFDIDADHIPTPCNKIHDSWRCLNCGLVGRGVVPEKCPVCGGLRFEEKSWPCEVCLETAKKETLKLLEMLMKDFGFSAGEIRVGFSGHRGYHVHVESEDVRVLDSMARKEIVDYVTGVGLDPRFHGLGDRIGERLKGVVGPDLNEAGWRGRVSRGVYEFLLKATLEDLARIGLKRKVCETLVKHKESLLESWSERGPWGIIKGVGIESWVKIVEEGAKLQAAKIDTVVTADVHRLIRLWETLHGKTGLKKVEVPLALLEAFDPLKSAVAFKDDVVTVYVSECPNFRVGETEYGPYVQQKVELPLAAAMMLLCKGAANVVQ
ncbi:MAG: DNA primase small subunit PriS [Candidatus Bathyarchaeia archaeon]